MSSIRNITSSTPLPPDLAKKIGVGGVSEILDVFWKGYQELKCDSSFVVNSSSEEDDITQKWYEKILGIWDSRNRATSIALNGLRPIHQYGDNTMKKRKGSKAPTIDFCFKDWSTDNSYFGAEAKNLYESRPDKIERYVSTGVDNYTKGRYGSQSSESSIIGYVLSGKIPDIVNELKVEMAKGSPVANLARSTSANPQYKNTISRYPLLQSCFVEYSNDRWALKERNNCELTEEMARMFDTVESEKAHKIVFSESFSEDCVVRFIELFSNMLPATCLIPIDKNGEHARKCFNYDILIRNTTLLYLTCMSNLVRDESESINLLIDDIFDKALNYGLILEEEQIKRDPLFGIYYILNLAKEKANVTP